MFEARLVQGSLLNMEEVSLELHGKLLELDKEKAENPLVDISQRRSTLLRQFIETLGESYHQILQENASLKAKIVKINEEHKSEMSLNAKNMNHIFKMHEKTQEALDEKTNELANIKQELQSVNLTNQELLKKIQGSKIVKNKPSELRKNPTPVNQNKTKTEVKVEIKEEPSKDLHVVHDNSKQIAKLTEGEENGKLKEERYFDEVHEEMGIDFVTSNTFDKEYLKALKRIRKKCPKSKLNQKEKHSVTSKTYPKTPEPAVEPEATPESLSKLVHTSEKPHSCQHCLKSFTKNCELKRHEMIHTSKKPHLCQYCSKSFRLKCTLKEHERIHTGEKPFSCVICQKSFRQASKLKNHERIHSGEKPYSCQYCSKLFSDRTTLKRHEMIHTGEKPFSCKKCKKSFARNGNLKAHEKIHNGEKLH